MSYSLVFVQDKAGSSAAAVAAYGGHVECVRRVLDSTAIASDRGMSALHLAVQVSDHVCRQNTNPGRFYTSLPHVMLFGSCQMVSDCCQ